MMSDEFHEPKGSEVPRGRLMRAGRMGGLGAGLVGRSALGGMAELARGRRPRLSDLMLTSANVTRVTDQLAQMRGAAMKMGQLLSMEACDILPL
jgi:predicted unusual protein kinase regulating ubiquinone biosynthesis (AarF/ABC1/UbiB family)